MAEQPVEFVPPESVRAWIEPLDVRVGDTHGPCGPDLEYDPEMQELEKAAAGKPETQFSAAEPPAWPEVRERAGNLFSRSRDLRVAMLWCRASINLEGFAAVPAALCLLHGLIDQLWDGVHPLPDPGDGDTFARVGALGGLDKLDSLLGDVRQANLVQDRRLPNLRVRTVEIALDKLAPRAGEETMSISQMQAAFEEMPEVEQQLRAHSEQALHWLKRLTSTMNDRFGIAEGVDLKNLRGMLTAVSAVLPERQTTGVEELLPGDDSPSGAPTSALRRGGAGGVHSIETRADAVRAIELICAYLERNEPTNPAQLLLRRASRLIDKNFLQLVRDFAPNSLDDVARIFGVSSEDIDSGSG